MSIASFRLQNFRSYKDGSFEFEPGVNIIVGPNGSGKTNLIEGLLMVAKGASYRGRDAQLVRFGSPWARLDAWSNEGLARTVKLEVADDERVQKTFELDGAVLGRLLSARQLPVVVFEPNHLQLIHAEPQLRRDFIDEFAVQLNPSVAKDQRDFKRVLTQRNALLKRSAGSEEFFVWDIQFTQLAERVVSGRNAAIEALNKKLTKTYRELGGKVKKLEIIYQTPVEFNDTYATTLLRRLHERRTQEIERGFTLSGPHRDDIVILFDGIDARQRASRGESRTIILALKVLELELLSATTAPLLLLDDVFSELDGGRRRALADRLRTYQTFITTTDADVVVEHFQDAARIISIN